MAELIDIYDANLVHQGEMEREQAHKEAQWHRTFHCWVVDGASKSLLFQRRAAVSKDSPNLLDVSAAGHLGAGEVPSAGVREAEEELGVFFNFNDLHHLGERVEVWDSTGYYNREYQSVYMTRRDEPLTTYNPQLSEVNGLVSVPIAEGIQLFSNDAGEITVEAYLADNSKEFITQKLTIDSTNFIPRVQRYYLAVFVMAERLLEEKFPLVIS